MSEKTRKLHCAVNFIPETGRNILVRVKELGTNSPTMKLDRSVFGDTPPTQHESFVAEVGDLLKQGNYLVPASCKVLDRELADAEPFDVDAYMAALTDEEPIF